MCAGPAAHPWKPAPQAQGRPATGQPHLLPGAVVWRWLRTQGLGKNGSQSVAAVELSGQELASEHSEPTLCSRKLRCQTKGCAPDGAGCRLHSTRVFLRGLRWIGAWASKQCRSLPTRSVTRGVQAPAAQQQQRRNKRGARRKSFQPRSSSCGDARSEMSWRPVRKGLAECAAQGDALLPTSMGTPPVFPDCVCLFGSRCGRCPVFCWWATTVSTNQHRGRTESCMVKTFTNTDEHVMAVICLC